MTVLVLEDQVAFFIEGNKLYDKDRKLVYTVPKEYQYLNSCSDGIWIHQDDSKGFPHRHDYRLISSKGEVKIDLSLSKEYLSLEYHLGYLIAISDDMIEIFYLANVDFPLWFLEVNSIATGYFQGELLVYNGNFQRYSLVSGELLSNASIDEDKIQVASINDGSLHLLTKNNYLIYNSFGKLIEKY